MTVTTERTESGLGEHYELSTHLIAHEFERRGHSVEWINFTSFTVYIGDQQVGFWVTRCSLSNTFAERLCTRKDVTATVLTRADIPVARGRKFRRHEFDAAAAYAAELGIAVVKPVNGMKGKGLTLKIETTDGFERAWRRALKGRPPGVLVERWHRGDEARFLVVGDRCVAVSAKTTPHVVGDGVSTVQQLVDAKNVLRSESPHLRNRLIHLRGNRIARIRDQGHELDSIPTSGETIVIDDTGNISTGAESVDVTDTVHPSYLDVAVRAAQAMGGLAVAGVDLLAQDYTQPAKSRNYIVVEVNSHPGIGGHHFPAEGENRDVAAAIVDHVIEQVPAIQHTEELHAHQALTLGRATAVPRSRRTPWYVAIARRATSVIRG